MPKIELLMTYKKNPSFQDVDPFPSCAMLYGSNVGRVAVCVWVSMVLWM